MLLSEEAPGFSLWLVKKHLDKQHTIVQDTLSVLSIWIPSTSIKKPSWYPPVVPGRGGQRWSIPRENWVAKLFKSASPRSNEIP